MVAIISLLEILFSTIVLLYISNILYKSYYLKDILKNLDLNCKKVKKELMPTIKNKRAKAWALVLIIIIVVKIIFHTLPLLFSFSNTNQIGTT